MTQRPILGVDPGVTGALTLLWPDQSCRVIDMPTLEVKPRRVLDLAKLADIFDDLEKHRPAVWMEQVGPRPTDGCVAAFSFGGMYWGLRSMCAAHRLPLEVVAPVKWRRAIGLKAGDGKDASRARASQLLPHASRNWPLVKHDGRAESALIALYGATVQPKERGDA